MRRTAWLAAGGAAVVVAAAVFVASSTFEAADDRVPRESLVGPTLTVVDIIGPDPEPQVNGAAELSAAGKWMDDHKGLPETWTIVGPWKDTWDHDWLSSISEGRRREFDAFFADAKPFFDLVAAALAKPRLRTPPETIERRLETKDRWAGARLMQILEARAIVPSTESDRLDAVDTLCKLAVRWESRSSGETCGWAWTMEQATTAIRRSLWTGDVDAAAWRTRLDGLLSPSWLARYGQAVRMQRAALLRVLRSDAYSRPTSERGGDRPSGDVMGAFRMGEDFRSGDEIPYGTPSQLARLLETTAPLETAATDSYPLLEEQIRKAGFAIPMHEGLNRVPPHHTVAWALVRTDAACRLARVALAASAHRARHGEFPASLDDLKDAFPDGVPLDPYMDAPFAYARTDVGVRIASSGRPPWCSVQDDDSLRRDGLLWELKK